MDISVSQDFTQSVNLFLIGILSNKGLRFIWTCMSNVIFHISTPSHNGPLKSIKSKSGFNFNIEVTQLQRLKEKPLSVWWTCLSNAVFFFKYFDLLDPSNPNLGFYFSIKVSQQWRLKSCLCETNIICLIFFFSNYFF